VLAIFQERKIRECIADVAEVVAEALAEGCQLIVTSEVEGAIGGENSAEKPKVFCHPVSECGVGGGGEVDWAASGVLLFKKLQKFSVIGQIGYV
jgi:hypothetical protein